MSFYTRVRKFNPHHEPAGSPKGGQFAHSPKGSPGLVLAGYSKHARMVDGVIHTSDVNDAVRALYEKRKVELDQPRRVGTLIDKLAQIAKEAAAKGEKAGDYDLCGVSVKGTNLFCTEHRGIPRIKMPQLKGHPVKGSKAESLPKDVRGEVDISGEFRKHLEKKGIKVTDADERSDYLKASQNELNGTKVGAIMRAFKEGKLADERLFVSKDNYVIDGHHRWAAVVGTDYEDGKGGDIKMKVARVDMSIIQVLAEARKFGNAWGLPTVGK